MTISDNQAHLDADIAALAEAFATAVAELKAAIAAGTPAPALDFTALDSLVTTVQAEATADAPPAPPVPTDPAPVDPAPTDPAPVDPPPVGG